MCNTAKSLHAPSPRFYTQSKGRRKIETLNENQANQLRDFKSRIMQIQNSSNVIRALKRYKGEIDDELLEIARKRHAELLEKRRASGKDSAHYYRKRYGIKIENPADYRRVKTQRVKTQIAKGAIKALDKKDEIEDEVEPKKVGRPRKYPKQKEAQFTIDRDELNKYYAEFFANGGKIRVLD